MWHVRGKPQTVIRVAAALNQLGWAWAGHRLPLCWELAQGAGAHCVVRCVMQAEVLRIACVGWIMHCGMFALHAVAAEANKFSLYTWALRGAANVTQRA